MNMQEYFDSLHPAERSRVRFAADSSERVSDEERTSRERMQFRWNRLMQGHRDPATDSHANTDDIDRQLAAFLGRDV